MANAKGKAVANKDEGQMALFSESMPEYMQGSKGRGSEDVSMDDLTIPRIDIIQAISPQRKKTDPEYIEGADEGMMYNTVSKELYPDSIVVVPVYFRKEYVIWKDRKKGGGFRGAFPTEVEAERARQQLEDGDDCEVVDTAQHFVLVLKDDGGIEEAVISMSKSKMKVNRQWNSMIRMAGGDRFSKAYRLSGTPDTNANGDDYFNFKVVPLGYVNEDVYRKAEHLYDAVKSGERDVARDEVKPAAGSGEVQEGDEF